MNQITTITLDFEVAELIKILTRWKDIKFANVPNIAMSFPTTVMPENCEKIFLAPNHHISLSFDQD